jgi:hypothetical protein
MSSLQESRNLAYEISLCRIALVADQVHQQNEQTSRAGGTLPRATRLGTSEAQLTYFWWVVLGGNKLRVVDLDVIPKDVSSELLEDWLALFREAALPIIGEEFTRAWMQRAERLARRFLITDGGDVAKLAKAS